MNDRMIPTTLRSGSPLGNGGICPSSAQPGFDLIQCGRRMPLGKEVINTERTTALMDTFGNFAGRDAIHEWRRLKNSRSQYERDTNTRIPA
ncbi:MAG: hypothetical protein P8Z00_00115 [Anaerolineales bacterium]|jgi:hypothetical protein